MYPLRTAARVTQQVIPTRSPHSFDQLVQLLLSCSNSITEELEFRTLISSQGRLASAAQCTRTSKRGLRLLIVRCESIASWVTTASSRVTTRLLQGSFGFQCNHGRSTHFIGSCNGRCLDLARARTDDASTEKGTTFLLTRFARPLYANKHQLNLLT
jgi:hypothetical protein